MAKLPLVVCRICHVKDIDRNTQKEGVDWIEPSPRQFYHKKCYENWKKSSPLVDAEWHPFIYDFIARDLKVSYNYHMCEQQIKKFIKEGYTIKGIYFTLKYFYEVKKGDWNKGHGGLGIVPYVYQEACTYWYEQEQKSKGIIAEIERQMRAAAERHQEVVVQKQIKPRKFVVDLDAIASMEDDE